MLRTMRKDFKKYSLSLWLVILAFVIGFVAQDAFRGKKIDTSGLVYANKEILVRADEYQQTLMRELEKYKSQLKENFNKAMITQWGLPDQILGGMVSKAIILLEAKKIKLSASDEEIKQKIMSDPSLQQDGKFIGLENYRRLLAYQHMDTSQYEESLRERIIIEKYQQLITSGLVIDDQTLREEYIKEKDKAEMDYFILRPERIKTPVLVDDNDPAIRTFYENNKNNFKTQEKRSGYVIAYKFNDFKKEVKVDMKEVRDFFQNNRAEFIIPGKTKVSRIFLKFDETNREAILKQATELQATLTKENFGDKARELSQDSRAQQGGDYGYTDWKELTSQEINMIETLNQGQISTPVAADKGFAIIYVPEKVAERQQVLDEVKDRISSSLEYEKLNTLVQEKLEKIYKKLENADNIKTKEADLGVKVIETELVTAGSPIKNLDEMGYISRQLFSMKEKEVQFPVQFADGLAIAQIAKIEKPVVEPFEAVKDKVKTKVMVARKVDMLMTEAQKYITELSAITDETKRTEYLKTNELTSEFTTYKRGNSLAGQPEKDGLDEVIFAAIPQQYAAPIRFEESVVIYKLKNKTITTPQDFTKDRNEFYQTRINQAKTNFFASYMGNIRKNYKLTPNMDLYIKIKDEVLSRFN